MDKIKAFFHKVKCFFIAIGITLKKNASRAVSPEAGTGAKKAGRKFAAVLGIIGRILLVTFLTGLLTAVLIILFGAIYVKQYLNVDTGIDLNQFDLAQSSFVLVENPSGSDNWEVLETLSGKENRIWITYDEIPKSLIDAVVAIEDKRFWSHEGVDWKRTVGAFSQLFQPDGGSFGGSTLTQQLIKNLTGDNDATVARKLQEIFRALAFERSHPGVEGKELILEYYLNTVYFGGGCYGIMTASEYYFGKYIDELTTAEAASLVGITNNPSLFNPYSNPNNNKRRQEVILYEMFDQLMLTRHEYNVAKYQPLILSRREEVASGKDRWFEAQLIRDLTADLMEEYGWSRKIARQYIFAGGIEIYATIDRDMQNVMNSIWKDNSKWPASPDAEPAEAAMMIIDHSNGHIKAMIGGREQIGDDAFDLSTMAARQPGSAIKPLTAYAPAFDLGLMHPYSPVDDVPIRNIGGAWPRPRNYSGRISVIQALTSSKNAPPCHVVAMVGEQVCFEYGRDNFGLSTLTDRRVVGNEIKTDIGLAPLALGGLTRGVTVRDMTGAYGAIANGGILNKPITYTHYIDQDGRRFDNINLRSQPQRAIKTSTAYYLEACLISAVNGTGGTGATGGRARLTTSQVAGKTGTTSDNKDRWFAGYTPYYTSVCWFGYRIGRDMSYYSSNPAIHMWQQVMEIIHKDLPVKRFDSVTSGTDAYNSFESFSYCRDSGLRVGENCRLDPRGDRISSGRVFRGEAPRQVCNVHKLAQRCVLSKRVAGVYCRLTEPVALLDFERNLPVANLYFDDDLLRIANAPSCSDCTFIAPPLGGDGNGGGDGGEIPPEPDE
jgi:penicillin-binding protein 1A